MSNSQLGAKGALMFGATAALLCGSLLLGDEPKPCNGAQGESSPTSVPVLRKDIERVKTFKPTDRRLVTEEAVTTETVTSGAKDMLKKFFTERGEFEAADGVSLVQGTSARIGNKLIISYSLEFKGMPISDRSSASAIVLGNGEALSIRQRNAPKGQIPTEPTVKPEDAQKIGLEYSEKMVKEDVHFSEDPHPEEKQPVKKESDRAAKFEVSKPALEIVVDEQGKGHLTWTFTVRSTSETHPHAYRYWVEAVGDNPKVIDSRNLVHFDHMCTVTGVVWKSTPLRGTDNRPLRNLDIVPGGSAGDPQTTNTCGQATFRGSGQLEVTAKLAGPFFVVQNRAPGGTDLELKRMANQGGSINLDFRIPDTASDEEKEFFFAQVSAFYWGQEVRQFVGPILGPNDLKRIPIRVNIDDSCNAFWDGQSLNFFRSSKPGSGSTCTNRAYCDPVFHEYGHAVDQANGGIQMDMPDGRSSGYSEGFGDSLATLFTRQPCYGRDRNGLNTCLRDASQVVSFPSSSFDPHVVGMIYSGFTWQMVQELRQTLSEDDAFTVATQLTLGSAKLNPKDIPHAVQLCFEVDDDDGDLTNGTPHFKALAKAADSRNIPRPPNPGH